MEKVTTINLAGNAYSLEETGFHKLTAYLAEARKKLAGNPDLEEIVNDFEAALAQKSRSYLNAHKTVITTAEVEKMLAEMGPVESDNIEDKTKEETAAPKRLYRIKEGAMISGVCNGLAAYFNIDITIVRIIFLVLIPITSGVWILAYFAMAIILPVAGTSEEYAYAYGTPPITAQSLIDHAQEGYKRFQNSREWREWKQQFRDQSRKWKKAYHSDQWRYSQIANQYYSPFWSFMHSLLGMAWCVLIVVGLWFAYHNSLVAKEYMDALGTLMQHGLERLATHVQI
jgi:phage shock protein PspC (stress-responsive transcriptional regulator)